MKNIQRTENSSFRIWLETGIVWAGFLVLSTAVHPSWAATYDCQAEENRSQPTTVEIVLSQKWKDQGGAVKQALASGQDAVKVRVRFFPFVDPPANIGIGKCVTAEDGRRAIQEMMRYFGKVNYLIRQDILPHHWVKIGSTDTAELAWIAVTPDDLARLNDPALTTEQFQNLYRQLATPKERKRPFGMGSERLEEQP